MAILRIRRLAPRHEGHHPRGETATNATCYENETRHIGLGVTILGHHR